MSLGIPADLRRYFSVRGTSVLDATKAGHQPIHARALLIGAFLCFFLGALAQD